MDFFFFFLAFLDSFCFCFWSLATRFAAFWAALNAGPRPWGTARPGRGSTTSGLQDTCFFGFDARSSGESKADGSGGGSVFNAAAAASAAARSAASRCSRFRFLCVNDRRQPHAIEAFARWAPVAHFFLLSAFGASTPALSLSLAASSSADTSGAEASTDASFFRLWGRSRFFFGLASDGGCGGGGACAQINQ